MLGRGWAKGRIRENIVAVERTNGGILYAKGPGTGIN